MKKKGLLIGSLILNLSLGAILLTSFVKKTPESLATDRPSIGFVSANQDSLTTAIQNVQSFVKKFDNSGKSNFVRAYTISSSDLIQVLGLSDSITSPFDGCRAYLGYNGKDSLFKLYLTPVIGGQDVFLNFTVKNGVTSAPNKSSYVLDLIAPCPNTCDSLSPLFTGSMKK